MSQLKVRRLPPVTRVSANGHATRVVIVENHQLVSESLSLLLDGQKDMEVVGSATSVAEAAALPRQLAPDVVVMDFHLDDGTGRDAPDRAAAWHQLFDGSHPHPVDRAQAWCAFDGQRGGDRPRAGAGELGSPRGDAGAHSALSPELAAPYRLAVDSP